ncbi:MAG: hypothetical protein AAF320_01370 [Myxococcota bacterium]
MLLLVSVGCGDKNKNQDEPATTQTPTQTQSPSSLPKSSSNESPNPEDTSQNPDQGGDEQDDGDALKTCRIKENLCGGHANDKTTCESFQVNGKSICGYQNASNARCDLTIICLQQNASQAVCEAAGKYNDMGMMKNVCQFIILGPGDTACIEDETSNPCKSKQQADCNAVVGNVSGTVNQKLCNWISSKPAKCEAIDDSVDPCKNLTAQECNAEDHCELQ